MSDLLRVEVAQVIRQGIAERSGEIGGGPRRLRLLDVGERRVNHIADRPGRCPLVGVTLTQDICGHLSKAAADLGSQLSVPPVQAFSDGFTLVGLGVPGGEGRAPL